MSQCYSRLGCTSVLPIVGPLGAGKSTLVERVRDRFSMILFLQEGSLEDERVIDLLRVGGQLMGGGWRQIFPGCPSANTLLFFLGLNLYSYRAFSLPDHSHDLVCRGVGLTMYSTLLLPVNTFRNGPAILWSIWEACNAACFRNKTPHHLTFELQCRYMTQN